jgi:predicted SAM-dependent methyltransferase
MNLHLGCGNVRLPGFVNIDSRHLPAVDRVDNIRHLRSVPDGSVDLVYCSHVLEHFSRWDYPQVLATWHRVLRRGGVLRVAVPDFRAIVNRYIDTHDLPDLIGLLYGGQDYPENHHHYAWDIASLTHDLTAVGFTNVRRYDARATEYAHIHDCSQAYLPRMDKVNGELMSLNVECEKR